MPYKNKKVRNQKAREGYWNNVQESRERERKRKRLWRDRNPGKEKNYYSKNKQKIKLYRLKPEVKKKIRIRKYADNEYRQNLLIKFNNKCWKCGSSNHLQIHHLSYEPYPGFKSKHDINNCIILCRKCHKSLDRIGSE